MKQRKRSSSDANDIVKKVVGKTKKGKELIVDQHENGMYFVKWSDGGQLPITLQGRYVRYEIAVQDIDYYLKGK